MNDLENESTELLEWHGDTEFADSVPPVPFRQALAVWLENSDGQTLKLIEPKERNDALAVIQRLENALRLEPAIKLNELCSIAENLAEIETDDDRDRIGAFYRQILDAEKLVAECTEEHVRRAFESHKSAKAWQQTYTGPLSTAKAQVKAAIGRDQQRQAEEAERIRREEQERRDAIARAEQLERQKAAEAAAAAERAERLRLQKVTEDAKAQGAAARAAAEAELRAAREREAAAKAQAAEVAAMPVRAEIVAPFVVVKVAGVVQRKGRYRGRVVNLTLVPDAYCMPRAANQAMIDAAAMAQGLELRIPGVEVYMEAGATVTKG